MDQKIRNLSGEMYALAHMAFRDMIIKGVGHLKYVVVILAISGKSQFNAVEITIACFLGGFRFISTSVLDVFY